MTTCLAQSIFTDMLQNENARPACPTVEGPRFEAVWAAPLRSVCCIFPAVSWRDARLAPLLVWDTPYAICQRLFIFIIHIMKKKPSTLQNVYCVNPISYLLK